jgi:hypothetical protein
MWRRIDEDPPEHQQDCLVSDGKSWPVCAIADVFDGVAWLYPRPELVEAGYLPLWWMPLPRLPNGVQRCETDFSKQRFLLWLYFRGRFTPAPSGDQ